MTLEVSSDVLDALLVAADQACPHECCGILLGQANRIEASRAARNVHASPANHFEIDPQTLVDAHRAARDGGPAVIGYYHSHPNGLPRPSATDEAMTASDGSVWAIIAAGRVTFWHAGDAGFAALPYVACAR